MNDADWSSCLKSISLELKCCREEAGLTAGEVMSHTGIRVKRIEEGKQNITLKTFIRLCELYEVAPGIVIKNSDGKYG